MADRIYIGPYDANSGLQTNYKAMVIPERAFAQLTDAYVYRGRVRKRPGTQWLGSGQFSSRLRINIGTTDGSGNFTGNVPRVAGGPPYTPIATPAIGQAFSIGSDMFTVTTIGAAAPLLRSDGLAATATYEATSGAATSGAVTINGASATTDVYFYPSLPVMGLIQRESSTLNSEPTIAFDTRFAYQYSGGGWERLNAETNPGDARWNGDDTQFFQAATWSGVEPFDYIFFVTNFNENEPNYLRYLSGSTWFTFRPKVSNVVAPNVNDIWLDSCRMFMVFKNRLVALNTWETSDDGSGAIQRNYSNRARYSQIGSPLDTDAWRQDLAGRGSAIDAPTREQIVGAQFVKDRLIVYFERSTWELVYTANVADPFAWQQINTELGAESTFSLVPFDRVVLGVGQSGIHACNGSNVERIDGLIPQLIFEIHNVNGGIERVYGIRDYATELVYWTYSTVDATSETPYPRKIVCFNYVTQTWALFEDSTTCFGYFQPVNGILWSSTTTYWSDPILWGSGRLQADFRKVIAGNQEGYTYIYNPDHNLQAGVLQITNISFVSGQITVTAINHNLGLNQYVRFENIVGDANMVTLNGLIARIVNPLTADTFTCEFLPSQNPPTSGTYTGGGTLSRIANIEIKSKEYNFYADKGENIYVSCIDFLVKKTVYGQITADYFVSSNINPMLPDAQATLTQLGTNILETSPYPLMPYEANQQRLWHTLYFQSDGEYFQLYLKYNDAQMRNTNVDNSDFELHAMILHTEPSSLRLQ